MRSADLLRSWEGKLVGELPYSGSLVADINQRSEAGPRLRPLSPTCVPAPLLPA